MSFHTDMAAVFEALGNRGRELDWIVGDLECNMLLPGLLERQEPQLFTGAELYEMVLGCEGNLQFIWGALIAVPPGSQTEAACRRLKIESESNSKVWESPPGFQMATSIFEILCLDSTETVLLSRDADISERFLRYFPEAVDLDEYNRRWNPG